MRRSVPLRGTRFILSDSAWVSAVATLNLDVTATQRQDKLAQASMQAGVVADLLYARNRGLS